LTLDRRLAISSKDCGVAIMNDGLAKPKKYNPKTWAEMTKGHKIGTVVVSLFLVFALSTCFMPAPNKTPEEAKAAVNAYVQSVEAAIKPCGDALGGYGREMTAYGKGRSTDLKAYEKAAIAKTKCKQAQLSMAALSAPTGLNSDVAPLVLRAHTNCYDGLIFAEQAVSAGMLALDGDVRPSVISEASSKADQAANETTMCKLALGASLAVVEANANLPLPKPPATNQK
jgi:hypothetical protein